METRFFLSRHGETQWNKRQKLQGQLDSPLTETGLLQASNIAELVKAHSIDLIVSSPLKRALTTATICQQKLHCPIIQQPKLMERHFGDWQAQLVKDVENHGDYLAIFHQVSKHKPPNGETSIDCALRFELALIEIANNNPTQNILVVSHGDVMRCFLSYIELTNINGVLNQYNNGCLIAINFNHQTKGFSVNVEAAQLVNDHA